MIDCLFGVTAATAINVNSYVDLIAVGKKSVTNMKIICVHELHTARRILSSGPPAHTATAFSRSKTIIL